MIKLTATETFVTAEEGENIRSISGIAVPWNTEATVSDGTRVKFLPGSLPVKGKQPKLLKYHDSTQPVGVVTGRMDTERGMLFTAKISKTRDGDDVVELIKDGAIDAVSVGVNPIDASYDETGTLVVAKGEWLELSLVTAPAFAGAQITEVAAAEATQQESPQVEATKDIQIESAAAVEAKPEQVKAPVWAEAKREFKLPSASEYVTTLLRGGHEAQQMLANIKAAAPDVVTTDTPGILPEPIVGPVYNNFRGLRPVVDAIGVKAMPAGGKVFRRPSVTTHTTIGASNGENANLDQGTFVVTDNQVTKGVYGGYVRLSEEDMDWTSPEVMGLLLDDMARIYANETDNVAADALLAATTASEPITSRTVAADWISAIYEAAATILTSSNGNLPTHLFLSPNNWAFLGKLVDDADRPLFPQIGPMNAFGAVSPGSIVGNAFGLSVVVDRNFAADTAIVGHPDGFEIFEQQKGAISVEAADGSLSRYIKFRGYFATLMIDADKFVKLV
jgi:HK97 family phage prohead protease